MSRRSFRSVHCGGNDPTFCPGMGGKTEMKKCEVFLNYGPQGSAESVRHDCVLDITHEGPHECKCLTWWREVLPERVQCYGDIIAAGSSSTHVSIFGPRTLKPK